MGYQVQEIPSLAGRVAQDEKAIRSAHVPPRQFPRMVMILECVCVWGGKGVFMILLIMYRDLVS